MKGLLRVYIILPMYIGLKDRGLNIRTIRQAVGRVGRAGAVGIATITRFMYEDCYTVDGMGNKVKDDNATKALGGLFPVYEVDPTRYATMVGVIKALAGDAKFAELGSYYDQLGFEGFKANV